MKNKTALFLLLINLVSCSNSPGVGGQIEPDAATIRRSSNIYREIYHHDNSGLVKWNDLKDRVLRGEGVSALEISLNRELAGLSGAPLRMVLERVNDYFNAFPYRNDRLNYSRNDYWALPDELLLFGGDCEDFAIAKYFALRSLGVPGESMKIAVVSDRSNGRSHAVLFVDGGKEGMLVLDNRTRKITGFNEMKNYQPVYSVNESGWFSYM